MSLRRHVKLITSFVGLSKEQLERMKQVNSFLEHNLKENGEMLATISKLQEERQELKRKVGELNHRLQGCSCSGSVENRLDTYSKYLRAESYRKALVWQKRYLLVQISGGYFDKDPVLKVARPRLQGASRFRAFVHAIISVHRMNFLVRRWRTGKRAGTGLSRPRTWSSALSSASVPEVHSDFSPSQRRPETLNLVSPLRPGTGSSPRTERNRVRRASSLRERPMGRSLESPGSVSSTSSLLYHPPVITGRTPPTRDVTGRRQVRGSDPGHGNHVEKESGTRRSLGTEFGGDFIGSSLKDTELAADLKDYMEKFHNLEKKLGVKF